MSCIRCGVDTNPGEDVCANCRQQPEITVLPPDERENFNGLTIEQDSNGKEYHQSETDDTKPYVFVKQFSFGSAKGSLLLKLFVGVIFLAVILFALPIALIFLAFFIIQWLFRRASR